MNLSKVYDPKKVETKIYRLWQKSGFFNPDKLPGKRKKTFTIVLPPPNITGVLHMGHALNATIQDIQIRWKRLQGYKTLWLPGIDHAGISTQNVVEKELKKEGLTRFDLGREKFIERIWQWKINYGNIILEQLKKIGCSLDWSRTTFTLDKNYAKAVNEAFSHYYKKGWIYKGKRAINWCPRCGTSLSDLELDYQEEKGNLWYIRYHFKNEFKKYITVATTRPETMLGDAAIAVNPTDIRYKNFVGKKVILPLVNKEISIITDKIVDPKFGTGAVKITPAHDLTDYEIGLRHNLEIIQVINEKGKITNEAPLTYQRLNINEARQKIVEDLKNLGLLEKIEEYVHEVPHCDRCKTIIELLPSEQWFLKMDKLAEMAKRPVENGQIKFYPKKWEKIYFNWLNNIKDWCISRQLWWGHKIPLPEVDDVLDTWFSSALWPFATLGWPSKTNDLKTFYPTNILSSDRGIINLWIARMIFSGLEFMKKIPFDKVYIHATVLTKEGKRMSKSLGTGIDPINLIEKYGADSTRFGIAWQITSLQDIRFSEETIIMGRKFCNKIWNASRFVLLQLPNSNLKIQNKSRILKSKKLTPADKRILKSLNDVIKSINKDFDGFQIGRASQRLYDFFWHDFCDKYIEASKKQNPKETQQILVYVLLTSLKLLHPFMPFITEEIYQKFSIKNKKISLMVEDWPN